MNDILETGAGQQTGDLNLADGTTLTNVKYCVSEPEGYLKNEDGSPIQMFTKITTDGYRKVKADDGKEYWVYNEETTASRDSLYTVKNLQIDPDLMQRPAKLGLMMEDGSVDNSTATALKEAFTEEAYTLNPNVKKRTTFVDYYTDMVAQIANSGSPEHSFRYKLNTDSASN